MSMLGALLGSPPGRTRTEGLLGCMTPVRRGVLV